MTRADWIHGDTIGARLGSALGSFTRGDTERSTQYHPARVELIRETPLEVAWHVWQARPPHPSLTVVVKGTFTLAPGVCTPATHALPTGDEHHDDDVERSIRYASDLEPLKPQGECMVIGSFHAPGGRPVPSSKVAFQIGPVRKQLAVFGDRVWHLGRASEPNPVAKLALTWEHAFGGPGFPDNPVGRGIAAIELDEQPRVMLPNLEDPAALVASREHRPRPAGFGPIPRTWPARTRLAGTYGPAWQRARYPYFPEDIDWRFFNAAPPDQQIRGYFRGDEEIVLRHLHAEHALLETRLPGWRAHAFVVAQGSDRLHDVGLALDTITVDSDEGVVHCVWRGVTEVAREDLSDLRHLFVTHEELGDRVGLAGFAARYRGKLELDAAEESAAEPEPIPPTPTVMQRAEVLAAMVDPEAPGAKWAHLDQAMTIRGDEGSGLMRAIQDALAARQREGALKPVFDDALGFAKSDSVERQLSAEELLELEMQLALGDLLEEEEDPAREELRQLVAAGESLAGRDLSGADLSGFDLNGTDLRGAILTRANLSGTRFEGAKLDGAVLREAELSLASFDGCSLREADLTSARAHRVRMHDCDLELATIAVSFLREGRFSSCRFVRADLRESDLGLADFRGCTLDDADLSAATLEEASFRESSLVDAWLEGGVKARRLRLDGCNAALLRASEEGDFEEASFKKTTLDGARFGDAKLRQANFSLAKLSRADFSRAFLAEAVLMGCDLRMARFDGATLVKASLLKANLMQARFEGANLRHADLRGTNLFQAELYKAKLEDARLDLADLHGTRLG